MDAAGRFTRLLRQPRFRRLVGVRGLSQGADAVIQVGMASFILFNPQSQPNAWAIAGVIVLVTVPFTVIGPFVSPLLDRFDRQRIVIACDLTRLALTVVMAVLVGTSRVTGLWQGWLGVLLLVTLSLNRLQLAALGAGIPFTVASDQYLEAASVTPMIGPVAGAVGGVLAGVIRLASGRALDPSVADALVFGLAGVLLAGAALLCNGFERTALGPHTRTTHTSWASVWSGFSVAGRALRQSRPVQWSVAMVFGVKLGYGVLMTAIILMYRHHFHTGADLEAAMVDMGIWFLASGLGYAASGLLALPASARLGVRTTILAALVAAVVVQLFPGALLTRPALVVTGLVLGLCAQSVKICADTVVQAHIADAARGRVMVVYDIVNNLGIAVGALVAASVLPADGRSVPAFFGLAVWYALLAAVFLVASRRDAGSYDRGTVRQPDRRHGRG